MNKSRSPGATDVRASEGAVKSADRALALLEALTSQERGISFAGLAERLGLPKSSLHGLLRTLVHRGWVHQDPATRRFTVGIRAWEAGRAYERAFDLTERSAPYMTQVKEATDETVQLALLDDRFALFVANVQAERGLMLQTAIARRIPAHAVAAGKVLLADLLPEELAPRLSNVELERFTPRTITDRKALEAEFDRIRRRGYANADEEYSAGVRSIAVAVRDASGRAVAGMSISAPEFRFGRTERVKAVGELRSAAGELSRALGYDYAAGRQPPGAASTGHDGETG